MLVPYGYGGPLRYPIRSIGCHGSRISCGACEDDPRGATAATTHKDFKRRRLLASSKPPTLVPEGPHPDSTPDHTLAPDASWTLSFTQGLSLTFGFVSAFALLLLLVCAVQWDQASDWVAAPAEWKGHLKSGHRVQHSRSRGTTTTWKWLYVTPWYARDISCFLARKTGLSREAQFAFAGVCSCSLLVVLLADGGLGQKRGDVDHDAGEEEECAPLVGDEDLEAGRDSQEDDGPTDYIRDHKDGAVAEHQENAAEANPSPDPAGQRWREKESCLRRFFLPKLPFWLRPLLATLSAVGFIGTVYFDAENWQELHLTMFCVCFAGYFLILIATVVMSAREAYPAGGGSWGEHISTVEDTSTVEKGTPEPRFPTRRTTTATSCQKVYVFALLCTAVLMALLLSLWMVLQVAMSGEAKTLREKRKVEDWEEFKKQWPAGKTEFYAKKIALLETASVYEWGAAMVWVFSILLVSVRVMLFQTETGGQDGEENEEATRLSSREEGCSVPFGGGC
eukprot:g2082.t1